MAVFFLLDDVDARALFVVGGGAAGLRHDNKLEASSTLVN